MKSTLVTCLIAAWVSVVCGTAFAQTSAREPSSDEAARMAVRKALGFLAKDTFVWREQRKCAACHHGPMFVWAANVAASQGYAVSATELEDITRWLATDSGARVFPRESASANDRPALSLATVFVDHALNAASPDDRLASQGRTKVAEHLLASQRSDGSWPSPAGRPPFFGSDATATRLARLAILESPDLGRNKALQRAAERAATWLAKQSTSDDSQTVALDVWAASRLGDASLDGLVAKLRAVQQSDGGWRQANDLPSDAFATGQALFALSRAKIAGDDEAVRRGAAFLARTQQADGTWPMQSQVDPTTGRRARNPNPITYAAAAWAALGIASHIHESVAGERGEPGSEPSGIREGMARNASLTGAGNSPDCPVGTCPCETDMAKQAGG